MIVSDGEEEDEWPVLFDRKLRDKSRVILEELQQRQKGFRAGFAVVQVGNREDSNVYIRHKVAAAEEIGIQARIVRLDSSTTERQVSLILLSFSSHILVSLVDSTN